MRHEASHRSWEGRRRQVGAWSVPSRRGPHPDDHVGRGLIRAVPRRRRALQCRAELGPITRGRGHAAGPRRWSQLLLEGVARWSDPSLPILRCVEDDLPVELGHLAPQLLEQPLAGGRDAERLARPRTRRGPASTQPAAALHAESRPGRACQGSAGARAPQAPRGAMCPRHHASRRDGGCGSSKCQVEFRGRPRRAFTLVVYVRRHRIASHSR